ncbi:hypothetical protein BGX38DRAFT_1191985 [Terfezia claveryi]|nr:hypothetical protein BGX38DRAFT_1191985 [Terfezia claveryi]
MLPIVLRGLSWRLSWRKMSLFILSYSYLWCGRTPSRFSFSSHWIPMILISIHLRIFPGLQRRRGSVHHYSPPAGDGSDDHEHTQKPPL